MTLRPFCSECFEFIVLALTRRSEGLVQVRFYVLHIFDTEAEANILFGQAGRLLLFRAV